MNPLLSRLTPALTLALPLMLSLAAPAAAQKSINPFIQSSLKDLTAEVKVVSKNDAELRKLGKGYADAYSMSDRKFSYKEPGKTRFEGKKGLVGLKFICNGDRKLTEVNFPRIRKIDDLSKEPGKGYSISDLGVLTADWLADHKYDWLRTEEKNGRNCEVFRVWHIRDPGAKNVYWIDTETKTLVEHVSHHRNRKKKGFKRRFVFSQPKLINGVWIPMEATVYNPENKAAGTVRYETIKVNTGLPDSMFKI